MNQENEKIYSEEKITIIKPIKSNHIWNEQKFEKVETYTKDGEKLIILRERNERETDDISNTSNGK